MSNPYHSAPATSGKRPEKTKDRRPRVLISIDSFYDGGAEMFAIRLANNLKNNAKVYFFSLRPWLTKDSKQKSLLDVSRVSVIELTGNVFSDVLLKSLFRLSRLPNLKKIKSWAMSWRLIHICRKYGIQIVHSHSLETDRAFAGVKNRCEFALVSTFHGHYELSDTSEEKLETETRDQLKHVDAVAYLAPNHWATLERFAVPIRKRHKIYNGIPVSVEDRVTRYRSGETLKLVMAARGIREKGWAETLEAVAAINHESGNVMTIDLLGTGSVLDRLRKKYEGCPYIRFLGYREDIFSYIKEAHIGLLPSYYTAESLPTVVVEFLMCGKPVIVTDVGAIREMITDKSEVAGEILPTNNCEGISPEYIKSALLKYLRDPDRVARDSEIALRAAQKFRMQYCVEKYAELYKSVLTPASKGGTA
jgi:glycosyltransferase involved in cell wall biosynthesis